LGLSALVLEPAGADHERHERHQVMRKNGSDLAQRHRVSQAQGMVSLQAHCAFGDALAMMTERAKVDGRTIQDIADAVLNHQLSFG